MKYLKWAANNVVVVLLGIIGLLAAILKYKSNEVDVLKTRAKTTAVNAKIEIKQDQVKKAEDKARKAKESYEEWKKANADLLDSNDTDSGSSSS